MDLLQAEGMFARAGYNGADQFYGASVQTLVENRSIQVVDVARRQVSERNVADMGSRWFFMMSR